MAYDFIGLELGEVMRVPSPAELRRTKQPIATDKLVRWAQQSGFEISISNHGSSHIHCKHIEHKDIYFNIIVNNKKPTSQRELSDALLEIEKRNSKKFDGLAAFGKAAEDRIGDMRKMLPLHIRAEYDKESDSIIIRDTQLPQLGAALKAGEERLVENKIRRIEDLKRDAYKALNRAGITIGDIDKKTLEQSFSHPVYNLEPMTLQPYQHGCEDSFFPQMEEFLMSVGLRDLEHKQKLHDLLDRDFIKATHVVYTARRGERSNIVSYEGPGGKPLRLTFTSFSNDRVTAKTHNDVYQGRISEKMMAEIENRINGVSRAHETLQGRTKPALAIGSPF